jgi:hypothetical protein
MHRSLCLNCSRAHCRLTTMAFRRTVCASRPHGRTRRRRCPRRTRRRGGCRCRPGAPRCPTSGRRSAGCLLLLVSGFLERGAWRAGDGGAATPQLQGRVWRRNSLIPSVCIRSRITYDMATPCSI